MTDPFIDFRTEPAHYRHWHLSVEGAIATLTLDVDEQGGLRPDYELKLNSYDLAVDIELADAVQRLRFEYPQVRTVVLTSARERVFSAGANIRMLASSSHAHKVNFCKFTNETRNAIEDAGSQSGQHYLCAINGTAAGGGYELALACEHILMVDDASTAVSLPELPLLAVLPGTGGLTRLVDKRKVRRDHADFFCTTEEGIRGKRALSWRLIDELAPPSKFNAAVQARAAALADQSDRPATATGVSLPRLERSLDEQRMRYSHVEAEFRRELGTVFITLYGPDHAPLTTIAGMQSQGAAWWPLALARELDDLLLHLRFNEPELGTLVFKSSGDLDRVLAYDDFLSAQAEHWLAREIILYWKRVLQRVELSARSLFALVEPGSCFAGTLLELVLGADRSFMLEGQFEGDNRPPPALMLSGLNFGPLPMVHGLTRLASRYPEAPEQAAALQTQCGIELDASAAEQARLVTFIPDDIDWEDEVRIALEERASFSPDALTGMEANLRFGGPETAQSKIFARLSAWQNWIFQRPNAVGADGALQLYGTGRRSTFDKQRV